MEIKLIFKPEINQWGWYRDGDLRIVTEGPICFMDVAKAIYLAGEEERKKLAKQDSETIVTNN